MYLLNQRATYVLTSRPYTGHTITWRSEGIKFQDSVVAKGFLCSTS